MLIVDFAIKTLIKINQILVIILNKLKPLPLQTKRCIPWFKDRGDETLRLNYDLNDDSIVIDLGGYEGKWSKDIFAKYACIIYIFEPVKDFCDGIKNNFSRNKKVKVLEYGLGKSTQTELLSISKDSSSIYIDTKDKTEIKIVRADDFFNSNNIQVIDLMKINIEGAEYDLLDHLIETGWIKKIKNVQVQFHDFVPDAESRMKKIQKELIKTHHLTYQYEFVWENWEIN